MLRGLARRRTQVFLSAGERRSDTQNTAIRDTAWHSKGIYGALRVNPRDAEILQHGLVGGHALQLLGAKRCLVVHGHDGLDEISVCAPTRVSELKDGLIKTYDIYPETFFGQVAAPENLLGGNPEENAQITRSILNGEKGPKRNIVLINTAAALMAAGQATDFKEGIQLAETAIDKGAATRKMEALIDFTQSN